MLVTEDERTAQDAVQYSYTVQWGKGGAVQGEADGRAEAVQGE